MARFGRPRAPQLPPEILDRLEPGMHADGRGLYLRVLKTGSRSWVFVYHQRGRRREMGLGGYRRVGLGTARASAEKARQMLHAGGDPLAQKRIRGIYTGTDAVQSPRMTYRIDYTQFTAADAARITGLSQDEQRDWRKRGFLPPVEGGKAAFDVKLLAGMLVAKELNTLGIGPLAGWVLARSCGAMIYTRLLNRRQGVYDPLGLAEGDLVQTGPRSDIYARWAITDDGQMWGHAATATELAEQVGKRTVVLDLDQLAAQIVNRANVLATIEAED